MKKILMKLMKLLKDPYYGYLYFRYHGNFTNVSDEQFLKIRFKHVMKKNLNLEKPVTFNEKLQWLKLYDRNPMYTNLVDKYEVRKFIAKEIGEEYLVPLIGLWDKFEDIDFTLLPNRFVLKTTHDSGGVVICTDKSKIDLKKVKDRIEFSLSNNYFYNGREWPYKNIKPRIICEQYIETENGDLPNDYKFHCFNGVPDNVMVCTGRQTGNTKFLFFNKEWKLLRYNKTGKVVSKNFSLPKPKKMNEMFEIAAILSKEIPFVRVDLYCENEKIYFGEMTFYPESGFDTELLEETDIFFGGKIPLNDLKGEI